MAAADDRGALVRSRRWRASGLGVTGLGLVLVLLAVALVQGRQVALLNERLRSGDDNVVLMV